MAQQLNSFDCGVHVLHNMELFSLVSSTSHNCRWVINISHVYVKLQYGLSAIQKLMDPVVTDTIRMKIMSQSHKDQRSFMLQVVYTPSWNFQIKVWKKEVTSIC